MFTGTAEYSSSLNSIFYVDRGTGIRDMSTKQTTLLELDDPFTQATHTTPSSAIDIRNTWPVVHESGVGISEYVHPLRKQQFSCRMRLTLSHAALNTSLGGPLRRCRRVSFGILPVHHVCQPNLFCG